MERWKKFVSAIWNSENKQNFCFFLCLFIFNFQLFVPVACCQRLHHHFVCNERATKQTKRKKNNNWTALFGWVNNDNMNNIWQSHIAWMSESDWQMWHGVSEHYYYEWCLQRRIACAHYRDLLRREREQNKQKFERN